MIIAYKYSTLTAFMPDNCCDNCMTTLMISGCLRVGEQTNSIMDIVASDC